MQKINITHKLEIFRLNFLRCANHDVSFFKRIINPLQATANENPQRSLRDFQFRIWEQLGFLSDEIYCKNTFILPMILTYPFSSIVAISLQIKIPNKIHINYQLKRVQYLKYFNPGSVYVKSLSEDGFVFSFQNILRRTYPEWNQPLGSIQASVFSLSSQYPSMTLYPRKQISPAVLMGTTRPWSSTIFALKI